MGRPRKQTVSLTVEVHGYAFTPVVQLQTDPYTGERKPVPVEINGKLLYALPGRLMAFRDDLPDIAARLKSSGKSPT